jgi:hypothetical protein
MVEVQPEDWRELKGDVKEILRRIAVLETVTANRADTCPHRVVISRASNNLVRLQAIEDQQVHIRIKLATLSATIGGITGTIGAIVTALVMKALGI